MIGLEYVLNLYNMQQQELAEEIGIRKQNINLWISGKQSVSKRHLPKLSEIFGIDEEYFQKELDEIDKLIIQKEKLKKELKPEIVGYDMQLMIGDEAELIQKPIYNTDAISEIEFEIDKTRILEEIRAIISEVNGGIELQMIEQISLLLKQYRKEDIFVYTVDALSHYYDILPDWVGEPESNQFVEEFIELAEEHEN